LRTVIQKEVVQALKVLSTNNHLKSKHRIECNPWGENHKTIPAQEDNQSQIVKKEMSLFEDTKKRSNNLKSVSYLNYKQAQISGTREGFFTHRTIFHQTQKQTEWWNCAMIVMRQCYEHHWKTVLNLIKKSLINCAGTNSCNFTMIPSFYRSKLHSFQNPGLPGFLFSVTWNLGFKILPRIGNTTQHCLKT